MKLTYLRPMIAVADLKATLDYYSQVLNFTILHHREDWGWASVEKDDVQIMFSFFNEHVGDTKSHFSGSFYFNTDDVNAWWELLKDKAEICYPIENFEYGMREFAIKDCNGYVLQFGQPLE
ncbi:MAG TPA: VOC family protein [Puia sp.]|nr:VOC family protein [Puia sp.]